MSQDKNDYLKDDRSGDADKKEQHSCFKKPFDAMENLHFSPYDDDLADIVKERVRKLSEENPSSKGSR